MEFKELSLQGSYLVSLVPLGDQRGWFARTYCKKEFAAIGHTHEWVQMNHSYTVEKGTIRGMHFQTGDHKEIKLVRCIAGAVFDVIVDLRQGSPTFLQWVGVELSAVNKQMIYIPEGFAHGFQTLEENTELIYHHSRFYSPEHESGLRYDDERLRIKWPLELTAISDRDKSHRNIDNQFNGI